MALACSQQRLFCIIRTSLEAVPEQSTSFVLFCRACEQPPANVDFQLSFSQDGAYTPTLCKLTEATAAVPDMPGETCISIAETLQTEHPCAEFMLSM